MVARHFLKHAIERADVKVHMTIQAGAEAVDKGQRANVQRRPVDLRRPRAVGLQALHNDPQEDAQYHVEHCPVALHEVAQSLRDGEHPLAHWQARKDVVRQLRHSLHHARVLHEWHTPRPFQE